MKFNIDEDMFRDLSSFLRNYQFSCQRNIKQAVEAIETINKKCNLNMPEIQETLLYWDKTIKENDAEINRIDFILDDLHNQKRHQKTPLKKKTPPKN